MCALATKSELSSKTTKFLYGRNHMPSFICVFVQALKGTTVSFCRESSIHGVRHIIEAIHKISAKNVTQYVRENVYLCV